MEKGSWGVFGVEGEAQFGLKAEEAWTKNTVKPFAKCVSLVCTVRGEGQW